MTELDTCPATRTVNGRTDICRRSPGHVWSSSNPARKEHYDPDHGEQFWMEHDDLPPVRWHGGSGRSKVYRAECRCGRSSGNGTRSHARSWAEAHQREVQNLTDVNGLLLREGDVIRAKLTDFDGPGHLFGVDLTVVKFGRTKVHVTADGTGGHTWSVTAKTTTRVKAAPSRRTT
uniref:hypothetical protein n=1 Tax=Nonomuraea sp. CA-251285 TaxID=3240002 RepID=UPI003F499741